MNRIFIYVFALFVCMGFISCSETDNVDVKNHFSFSEIKELDLSLLENDECAIGYFTLDATGKCVISSDKMWVTFSTAKDGEYFHDIQCNENIESVYVKVGNEAREFVDAIAVVTLFADGEEFVVGTITRSSKSYSFGLKGEDDAALETVRIDDKATAWVTFDANFECGIVDYPEWLVEPVWENDGYRFNVADGAVPMAQNGKIVFANSSMTQKYEFQVSYDGMNPETMRIDGDSPWGWIVSLDGKEFKKDASASVDGEENTIIMDALNMTVMCRDYSYKTIFAEDVSGALLLKEDGEAWIRAERDESAPQNVQVSVDKCVAKSTRSGYLFAVPDALYDKFKEDLEKANNNVDDDAESDETGTVWDKFWNKYEACVLAQVTQKDQGFRVTLKDGTDVPCETDENADYYIKLNGEFIITDIMACDVVHGESYVINTKLTAEDWSENYILHDINYVEIREKLWKLKLTEGDDGYYMISITVPTLEDWDEEWDKNVVLRIYTPELVPIKALVLRVQE